MTDAQGKTKVEVKLSEKAIEQAAEKEESIRLPVPPVKVAQDGKSAPVIEVDTGTKEDVSITIPVQNPPMGTVAVIVHKDGTQEVARKSAIHENGIRLSVEDGAVIQIVDNSKMFHDTKTHWAKEAVDFVSSREIINGTGRNTFAPNLPTTRGMVVTVLHNMENNPVQNFAGHFADVESNLWYAESVKWAAEQGIVSGIGENRFAPEDIITREQLTAILHRFSGATGTKASKLDFVDEGAVSGWAQDAMKWAVQEGLITGTSGRLLDPTGEVSRAQLATILFRYISLGNK